VQIIDLELEIDKYKNLEKQLWTKVENLTFTWKELDKMI